jgi:hypothetical protein
MQELAPELARLAAAIERYVEGEERRERDARRPALRPLAPTRLGVAALLKAIPGLAAKFDRIVPPNFVAQTGADEVTVACPCGASPQLRPGRLAGCECGRWFLHDGRDIHVALSPAASPAVAALDDNALSETSA